MSNRLFSADILIKQNCQKISIPTNFCPINSSIKLTVEGNSVVSSRIQCNDLEIIQRSLDH